MHCPLLIDMVWSISAILIVFTVLAFGIFLTLLYHSRKTKEMENRFRLLFNRVFDALILIDGNGGVIDINDSAIKLIGYDKPEIIGDYLGKLLPNDELARFRDEISKVLKSGIDYLGESTLIKRNGEMMKVEAGCTLTTIGGKDHVLLSLRDITTHKRMQDELKEKNAVLQTILTSIEAEKLQVKNEFASTIDQVLLPTLHKIVDSNGSVNKTYLDLLENTMREMVLTAGGLMKLYAKLSPREIEICNLIRNGATTKEVAQALGISDLTVNKHRERIRKKLVISKKDISLTSFLKTARP